MTLSKSSKDACDKLKIRDMQIEMLEKYHQTFIEKGERLDFHHYKNMVENILEKKIADIFRTIYDKIDHRYKFCVPHILLYECEIFTGKIDSYQIKRKLEQEKFVKNEDYIVLHNVAEKSSNGGGSNKTDFHLTKATFNKMLMRSKNHPEYADHFTFLEMCIEYHKTFLREFDLAMEKKASKEKDNEIFDLKKTMKKLEEEAKEAKKERIEAKKRHDALINEVGKGREEIANITSIVEDTNELLEETNQKLELSLHSRVPHKETPKSKQGQLLLMQLFPTYNEEYYNYAVIRGQTEYCGMKLKTIKKETPTAKLIYKLNYTPNSCDLWLRVKKELKQQNKIDCRGASSNFDLTNDFTKENLITLIRAKNREKYDLNK
jgi:hypothetical protein